MSPLYQGKSLPVPDVEKADSFSVQSGEYLFLHKAESVPLLYVVGQTPSRYRVKTVFSIHRRECPSAMLWRGHTPCLERGGRVFYVQRTDTP